jgi:hypothetical protein
VKLFALLFQLLLIALVGFFGYQYFSHPELRACVTTPLTTLIGKTAHTEIDEAKVNQFLESLGANLTSVASKSARLTNSLKAVSAHDASSQSQLLDQGQYLYCKAVVDKVETN